MWQAYPANSFQLHNDPKEVGDLIVLFCHRWQNGTWRLSNLVKVAEQARDGGGNSGCQSPESNLLTS